MLLNAPTGEKAHDSWEIGAGIEATGPRVIGQTLLLRAGGRSRTLPFEAAGKTVTERAASLGTGANFGGGRMSVDAALLRQWRNADLPTVSERAWTFSLSLPAARYADPASPRAFVSALLSRLAAEPGVRSAAVAIPPRR